MNNNVKNVLSKNAHRIVKDFENQCHYIDTHPVKISTNTENIGREDCFQINQLLSFSEHYEKSTRFQPDYSLIDFFHYCMVEYELYSIKKRPKVGLTLVKAERWKVYEQLSTEAKYLFLFSVFVWVYADIVYRDLSTWDWLETVLLSFSKGKKGTILKFIKNSYGFNIHIDSISGAFKIFTVFNFCEAQFIPRTKLPKGFVDLYKVDNVLTLENGLVMGELYNKCVIEDEFVLFEREKVLEFLLLYAEEIVSEEIPLLKNLIEVVENEEEAKTFLLKISLYNGSYWTIKIGSEFSLDDLHMTIQEIVEFENDHLYAFTLGSGIRKKMYFAPSMNEELLADEVILGELDLFQGKTFEYLFDFGDSWQFEIRVEAVELKTFNGIELIEQKGEKPQQYKDWEEE